MKAILDQIALGNKSDDQSVSPKEIRATIPLQKREHWNAFVSSVLDSAASLQVRALIWSLKNRPFPTVSLIQWKPQVVLIHDFKDYRGQLPVRMSRLHVHVHSLHLSSFPSEVKSSLMQWQSLIPKMNMKFVSSQMQLTATEESLLPKYSKKIRI